VLFFVFLLASHRTFVFSAKTPATSRQAHLSFSFSDAYCSPSPECDKDRIQVQSGILKASGDLAQPVSMVETGSFHI